MSSIKTITILASNFWDNVKKYIFKVQNLCGVGKIFAFIIFNVYWLCCTKFNAIIKIFIRNLIGIIQNQTFSVK